MGDDPSTQQQQWTTSQRAMHRTTWSGNGGWPFYPTTTMSDQSMGNALTTRTGHGGWPFYPTTAMSDQSKAMHRTTWPVHGGWPFDPTTAMSDQSKGKAIDHLARPWGMTLLPHNCNEGNASNNLAWPWGMTLLPHNCNEGNASNNLAWPWGMTLFSICIIDILYHAFMCSAMNLLKQIRIEMESDKSTYNLIVFILHIDRYAYRYKYIHRYKFFVYNLRLSAPPSNCWVQPIWRPSYRNPKGKRCSCSANHSDSQPFKKQINI